MVLVRLVEESTALRWLSQKYTLQNQTEVRTMTRKAQAKPFVIILTNVLLSSLQANQVYGGENWRLLVVQLQANQTKTILRWNT